MPYTRNAAGAWTISAEAGSVAAVPTRLVIIDKQVIYYNNNRLPTISNSK